MVHPICKQHQNITIKVIWEPYGEVFGDGLSCWNPPSKSHRSMKQFTTCLFLGGSFNQRVILPTCFLFNFNGFNLPKLKSRVFPCNQKKTNKSVCYCWWFRHPANQLRCEKIPFTRLTTKNTHPNGGFFPPEISNHQLQVLPLRFPTNFTADLRRSISCTLRGPPGSLPWITKVKLDRSRFKWDEMHHFLH